MLGNTNGHWNPDKVKTFGDKVAIRRDEIHEEVVQNGIVIPNKAIEGFKGVTGTVISVGEIACSDYNINVGDRVKFDHCAVFYDTEPVCVLNAENIIVKLNDDNESIPLKNMVFVRYEKTINQDCGIIIPERNTDMRIGVIFKVDNTDVVKVGDRVVLTTDCDQVNTSDGTFYIYKNDDLLAVFEDE